MKMYYKAVHELNVQFDMTSEAVHQFSHALNNRGMEFNWMPTILINIKGKTHNLFLEHSVISYKDLKSYVVKYHSKPTRNAQNAMQICKCIENSITEEASNRIQLDEKLYTIKTKHGKIADGLLLFKALMMKTLINTNATISLLRSNLARLPEKVPEMSENITKIHEYAMTQVNGLAARGAETHDLIIHLFAAYKVIDDAEFRNYINAKEDQHNEDTPFEPHELMGKVEPVSPPMSMPSLRH